MFCMLEEAQEIIEPFLGGFHAFCGLGFYLLDLDQDPGMKYESCTACDANGCLPICLPPLLVAAVVVKQVHPCTKIGPCPFSCNPCNLATPTYSEYYIYLYHRKHFFAIIYITLLTIHTDRGSQFHKRPAQSSRLVTSDVNQTSLATLALRVVPWRQHGLGQADLYRCDLAHRQRQPL